MPEKTFELGGGGGVVPSPGLMFLPAVEGRSEKWTLLVKQISVDQSLSARVAAREERLSARLALTCLAASLVLGTIATTTREFLSQTYQHLHLRLRAVASEPEPLSTLVTLTLAIRVLCYLLFLLCWLSLDLAATPLSHARLVALCTLHQSAASAQG